MLGFAVFFPVYFTGVFKNLPDSSIISNKELTTVGARGLLINGVARLPWGFAQEKFGFRACWFVLNVTMCVMALTVYDLRNNLFAYSLASYVIQICFAAVPSILPAAGFEIFGMTNGPVILCILLWITPIAGFAGPLLNGVFDNEVEGDDSS